LIDALFGLGLGHAGLLRDHLSKIGFIFLGQFAIERHAQDTPYFFSPAARI
jgi:hypothetical protein